MGQVIGYARVSSVGQSLEVQLDKLETAGCERVYQEKASGTSTDGREQLAELLRYVREGDEVVITKLDRLGRSLADLLDITEQLEAKGVTLRVLDQNLETTTAQGKLMFTMLGAFAEFETALRKERQMEGIAKAKAAGKYTGRPKSIDENAIKATLLEGGKSLREIAALHGVSRATVHRLSTKMREHGELS
ncbi:recombinase family protein [Aeromonas caviae]|uniref:recombinase family protein n=1 Tax=Aeromonas caviae TaxID=648 RepID=UPI000855DB54|nr:recombinase family protein [Aeromonas caviae]OCW45306.1 resolvase [Aeromonas caviae]WGY77174.1 recombinase family protein [Aeromonas caviae]